MKKLILSSVTSVAMLFLFSSCVKEIKTALTDKQKEAIVSEVKQVFEYTLGGIENRDAERAFSAFTENTKLLQEGYIITDLEKEKNGYKENFSKPGPMTKITCDPLYFDVLDANNVLVTTIGSIASVGNTNPDEKPWVVAYTMLFKKEAEGWKVNNMHMSWKWILLQMGYDYSFWFHLNNSPEQNLEPSAMSRLNEIKLPTLIITAQDDLLSCKEIAVIMEKEISGSRKVVMKEAGHIMNMDKPEEFNRYITDFIDNLK